MIKAKFKSTRLFSAYASYIKEPAPYVNRQHVQYYCASCSQQFSANWDIKVNPMSYYLRGTYCLCPYCGTSHSDNIIYENYGIQVPEKIELTVNEYKEKVVFTASYSSFSFDETIFQTTCEDGIEKFIFTKNKAYYRKIVSYYDDKEKVRKKRACTTPINEKTIGAIERDSILYYLGKRSLLYKDKDLRTVIKTLHVSVKKLFGKNAHSIYLDTRGLRTGLFLRAIFNYALKLGDIPKSVDRENRLNEIDKINWISLKDLDTITVNCIVGYMEQGFDEMTSIIKGLKLPDTKSIRRIVAEKQHLTKLRESFRFFSNFDYAIRYYGFLTSCNSYILKSIKLLIHGLKDKLYTEKDLITFIEKHEEYQTADCGRMYSQLNDEFKNLLKIKKVRARELHDWLVTQYNTQNKFALELEEMRHREQRIRNREALEEEFSEQMDIALNIPEHIKKRLVMQVLNSNFHLPQNCRDMLQAGQELDNCIGSYFPSVKREEEIVVFISDDNGKLKGALSIIDNCIVQAEISSNKAIRNDKKLNRAVVEWSKKAGLEIDTHMINTDIETIESVELALTS